MATKKQQSGMRGVYLVAAELARRDFVVSPTSRSAAGADLLVTNQSCSRAYSVQVKTNTVAFWGWLVGSHAKTLRSRSHIYVLVNLKTSKRTGDLPPEYFVVPSAVMAKNIRVTRRRKSSWYDVRRDAIEKFRDRWSVFGSPT